MARDSGPVSPLEQSRVSPGHWLIEGYDVLRVGDGWRIFQHFEVDTVSELAGAEAADLLARVDYLAEARDWIRNKLQERSGT